jgi:uncharacterized cupin superfamily protein
MQIRVLPIHVSSGEVIDRLQKSGVDLPELRILRIDLAWEMFYGRARVRQEGRLFLHLPQGKPRDTSRQFLRWIKATLSQLTDGVARSLKQAQEPVLVLLPDCTAEVKELVLRQLSFFSEDVLEAKEWDGQTDPFLTEAVDAWMPPVIKAADNTDLLRHQSEQTDRETVHWYVTALGIENVYVQKYTLHPGAVYSRMHSHSDVDELYLVLAGHCTVRIGTRDQIVCQGDLVSKPKGTGLSTQIFNHTEEPVTIMDFEIWERIDDTDLAIYSDHGEVLLRGQGFRHYVPLDAIEPADDLRAHYDTGYRRQRDGSYVPQEMRGVPPRK